MTPSKILHDVVSDASTILSISQMAMFTHEDMSEDMQNDFKRIMDTAHDIVALIDQLGQLLDDDEDEE